MVRLGLFLTLLLLSCRLAATPSGEKVSWMRADLPPQWILDGELADQGWGDVQMRGLFPQLPGYDHQVIQGSLSRIWYEIEHRDGVCFTGAARNAERETFAVFSHRAIVVPAYGVTVRAHDVARFARALDEDRVIDLDKLGEDDKLTGGYTASREHFPAINLFLASGKRRVRMDKLVSPSQLFNLLHAGRLDFIFAEPVEAPYYKARFHLSSEFITLPIKGNAPSIKGYVVCSNGPIGRALITQLDLLLDQDDAWARFLRPLRRWMTAKDFAKALAQKPE
jgi:uncharacterized protein (TIGR02285 family)